MLVGAVSRDLDNDKTGANIETSVCFQSSSHLCCAPLQLHLYDRMSDDQGVGVRKPGPVHLH